MKKTVRRIFWKYLLIFTIPFLAAVGLFLHNYAHVYRTAISELQMGALTQMSGELDVLIDNLSSLSEQMGEREDIVNISRFSDAEKCDILQIYDRGLPERVSLLYYFRHTNNIYFQNSILTYHEFEQSSYFDVSLNFMGFFTQLNSSSYVRFIPVDAKARRGEMYSAALMAPIPSLSSSPTGTVAFLISRTYFDALVEKYFGDIRPDIFVLDTALNIVFDGNGLVGQDELKGIVRNNPLGVGSIALGGEKYVLMRSVSAAHGLYFVVLADEDAFYDGSGNESLIITFIALVYLICVFLALAVSRRAVSEVELAESRIAENDVLLKRGREQITELVILRLLGASEREGVRRLTSYLDDWGGGFKYRYFCLAAMCPAPGASLDELCSAAVSALRHAAGDSCAVYSAVDRREKRAVAVINTDDPDLDRAALMTAARDDLDPQLRGKMTVGVGGIYEGEGNISVSYLDALTAEDTREARVQEGWYLFRANRKTPGEPLPYADLALVEQSILSGSADISTSVLRKAFEKIDRLPSRAVRRCLYFDMVNLIIKIYEGVDAPMSSQQLSRLTAVSDLDVIRRDVTYAALSLTEHVKAQLEAPEAPPAKRSLVEYVQSNFMDSNLSLSRLAEEFGLSYTYVSRTFKTETGRSFQAYLTDLRIDYVKDMLMNTNTPIKDIVLKSGYLDVANFTRKFKQIEGITPGQFRQLHKR